LSILYLRNAIRHNLLHLRVKPLLIAHSQLLPLPSGFPGLFVLSLLFPITFMHRPGILATSIDGWLIAALIEPLTQHKFLLLFKALFVRTISNGTPEGLHSLYEAPPLCHLYHSLYSFHPSFHRIGLTGVIHIDHCHFPPWGPTFTLKLQRLQDAPVSPIYLEVHKAFRFQNLEIVARRRAYLDGNGANHHPTVDGCSLVYGILSEFYHANCHCLHHLQHQRLLWIIMSITSRIMYPSTAIYSCTSCL
jgi:hypothetical protein